MKFMSNKRDVLNLCGQINKTQENAMAGTEENTLVLESQT